jgi:photosystem II stability/assembly factor-like uncharacterized protein
MHSPARTGIPVIVLAAAMLCCLAPERVRGGWVRQFSGSTVRLTDVLMLDSTTAIVVGYGKTILKTTDAGETWIKKSSIGFNLNAVAFKDQSNGLAVGDNHLALFTSDGGESWVQRGIGGFGHFLSVAFLDQDGIFIGTDGGTLHLSTDGGATWLDSSITNQAIYRIVFVRGVLEVAYTGFAFTPRAVFKTTDQGVSWSASPLPLSLAGSALRGDCGPGAICYAVGYDGGELPFSRVMRRGPSDSAWTTFQFTQPSPSIVVRAVSAPSATVAYACGSSGLILRTTDGGLAWETVPIGMTRRLNAMDFVDENRGIAVGDSGTILTTISGTTAVPSEPAGIPGSFQLEQNYPNPFNGETLLGYDVPPARAGREENGRVTLMVYDVLGRRVATLFDGPRDPGSYTLRFKSNGLASGIYVATLHAGSTTVTRKMLLIR